MTGDSMGRLAVTWRPDADLDPAGSARLDRLVAALVDGGLDGGLVPSSDGAPTCVRRVVVPVHRMQWDGADDHLVAGWATALRAAVEGAVDAGGEDVVRFRSRPAARQDLVTALLRGDRAREWAWRLLGLWPAGGADGTADVLHRVLLELGRNEPSAVPGLLVAVARARLMPQLVAAAGAELVAGLVERAWQAAGGPRVGAPTPGGSPVPDGPVGSGLVPAPGAAEDELCTYLLDRSEVARAPAGAVPARSRGVLLPALAAAAVLEVEPALARRPGARALRAALAARLAGAPVTAAPPERPEPYPTATGRGIRPGPSDPPSHPAGSGTLDAPQAGGAGTEPAAAPPPPAAPGDPAPGGPAEATAHRAPAGATGWGGLLFLLPVVADLALPQRVADDPRRFGPVLRLVLHELARTIVARADPDGHPAAADDPAVLAFAGLPPTAPPPRLLRADLRLDPEVDAVAATLAERLPRTARDGDRAAGELFLAVCRRRAVVVADPGWIDVELDPEEVDVEVRRAGLDLDPGYVPWLGCVVRFRYG
ncbi:hypothetical protein SAMN05660350_03482 [Geodermatophilus obscurus]|uniref:Uncharacterized protein n=1 Tax=Geodermatophilus obscurus TaxID=1861 RepID=A0A1M7UL37_9ACTN|nr:hypothetical protein [Geodermatophilus obscurus]SHN83743.1 hypothetical protein SAMN05660350_03482 [Geodermatophilus obscurus]